MNYQYCVLTKGFVDSLWFLKKMSPHSPMDSPGFSPMSIVPTVVGSSLFCKANIPSKTGLFSKRVKKMLTSWRVNVWWKESARALARNQTEFPRREGNQDWLSTMGWICRLLKWAGLFCERTLQKNSLQQRPANLGSPLIVATPLTTDFTDSKTNLSLRERESKTDFQVWGGND